MTARVQRGVLAVLLAVAAASALVATLVGTQTWDAALLNFGTEMAGAVVTYVLLQLVIGGRARKEDLIADLGSNVRDVAVAAAEIVAPWKLIFQKSVTRLRMPNSTMAIMTKASTIGGAAQ